MGKIYNKYMELKNEHAGSKEILLFKSGMFYIMIEEDAMISSKISGLKIIKFGKTGIKTGFPIESLNKFKGILDNVDNSYSFFLVEEENIEKGDNNSEFNAYDKLEKVVKENKVLKQKVLKLVKQINSSNIYELSLNELSKYINEIEEISKDIVNEGAIYE